MNKPSTKNVETIHRRSDLSQCITCKISVLCFLLCNCITLQQIPFQHSMGIRRTSTTSTRVQYADMGPIINWYQVGMLLHLYFHMYQFSYNRPTRVRRHNTALPVITKTL